ncbi:GTP pyrophosphokinase [Candidatus Hakubella thermalkaliphila]|uniref:GTP pyrophosphokinase n=2 Tax=Candidatus Hakubella thermalkaliphila TaxID=2754717 RepID=A0A6V8PUL1_9ACTN|nr:bifunctional (p)ppGpp synthetase/guanosine-3',5'-bis(diphosphate) 3'-pyrophosphohydrolase [Candidatus Hakubella thermalkaliphila]GFP34706.1 GTP pyrophosphokinase [Candidatus Hakubella thermalkaliphila]
MARVSEKTDIDELIEKIKEYHPAVEDSLIKKAYQMAQACHLNQKRRSGEPYIAHPIGVAYIIADMRLDTASVISALLHDIIEDSSVTIEDVREEFGDQIATIVDGVTRINRLSFRSDEEEQAENLRKMLIAMAKDIRIILVKLADRLHNMRTLYHLHEEKRITKAKETLDVYAPLAHRLGMSQVKCELEDLAFTTIYPKQYQELNQLVYETAGEREEFINRTIERIEEELTKVGITAEFGGRAKHLYSIYQKMTKQGREFKDIYDLVAVRVIVDTVKDCYGALGIIHSIWKPVPGRFKDYIANPKFNMYQSLHTTVIGFKGRPLEIQIRSHQMHRTSEYGIAAHWRYKEGGTGDEKFEEKLAWLRQILEWQQELSDPREFMESLKLDLFEDEVFVFTPKGKVISLPMGSTPIDFAYEIHTDVGHGCVGARVNNRIVPLEQHLRSGDIVEIITSKSAAGPSRDWLSLVKTARARSKIKQWFSQEEKKLSQNVGREMLQKALRKHGLSLQTLSSEILEKVTRSMHFGRVDKLYQNIGANKISPHQVCTRIIKEKNKLAETYVEEIEEELVTEELVQPLAPRSRFTKGVRVKGLSELLAKLARCCNPVPGDDIVGYVTRGQGVSVHRTDCTNLVSLSNDSERFIEVSWNPAQPSSFQVEIQVEALDRTKLLRDITTVLGEYNVNIVSANVALKEKEGIAISRFVFEIGNLSLLNDIISNIKRVDSVFDAYRVTPDRLYGKSA